MEELRKPCYIVLVARLPSPDDTDRDTLTRSAHSLYKAIPNLSQSRIVIADSKFEKLTAEILKREWHLPDSANWVTYNELFSSKKFQDDPRGFTEGVVSYFENHRNTEGIFTIIGSTATLNAIMDILRAEKHNIRWTVNVWMTVFNLTEGDVVFLA